MAVITAGQERLYHSEKSEGMEVHYLPVAYDNKFNFYKRAWAFFLFAFNAARFASRFRDFNCCYAISVPLTVGITARWLDFRYQIPYYFEVGDLWPDAPIQLGFIRNYFLKNALLAMERSIYRHSKSIVALSPAIQLAIKEKVPGKSIHMIPNMADCDFFRPVVKDQQTAKEFGVENKFVVSYIGAMGIANGLDFILHCASECDKACLPIHFILCGDGAKKESLKEEALELKLTNVSFSDFVNRDGVRRIMDITDAAFVCFKNHPILETGSPNKFFDGLAAGKLIVVNFGGWVKTEVEMMHCGVAVDPENPESFVTKIKPYITDLALLAESQSAARKLAEEKYSRVILSERFVELFR